MPARPTTAAPDRPKVRAGAARFVPAGVSEVVADAARAADPLRLEVCALVVVLTVVRDADMLTVEETTTTEALELALALELGVEVVSNVLPEEVPRTAAAVVEELVALG